MLKRLFASALPKTFPKNESLLRFKLARLLTPNSSRPGEPEPVSQLLASRPPAHDLILVDSRPDPPLVRFQAHAEAFKTALRQREAETRARLANKLKEAHFSTATGDHDFSVKAGKIEEWLQKGWRVRVLVEERKRNSTGKLNILDAKVDQKRQVLHKLLERLEGVGEQSGQVEVERGKLVFTLGPSAKVLAQLKRKRMEAEDKDDGLNKRS